MYGSENIVGFLLSKNEINKNPINIDGDTPLHIAARGNQIDLVNKLFQNGANASLQNSAGQRYSDLLPALPESKNTVIADTDQRSSLLWSLITWLPNMFIDLFTKIYNCFCGTKEIKVQASDVPPKAPEQASATASASSSIIVPSLGPSTPMRGAGASSLYSGNIKSTHTSWYCFKESQQ